ncbi:hypothetical protein BSZ28_02215 [Pseudomonas moraviensis]|nr:hypothetical protein BSZ28_02215 [Pseudomonas moraviensis]
MVQTAGARTPNLIVPTLRVGMPHRTLCVRFWDAERPWLHSHAERGNDQQDRGPFRLSLPPCQ